MVFLLARPQGNALFERCARVWLFGLLFGRLLGFGADFDWQVRLVWEPGYQPYLALKPAPFRRFQRMAARWVRVRILAAPKNWVRGGP